MQNTVYCLCSSPYIQVPYIMACYSENNTEGSGKKVEPDSSFATLQHDVPHGAALANHINHIQAHIPGGLLCDMNGLILHYIC